MHPIIEDLNWRYATKKYDPSKKVSTEDLEVIKESLRLTPTSYGLQPFKFLIIESEEIRQKLLPASYGQTQIIDASHVIVLCSQLDMNDEHIDGYMSTISETREIPVESLEQFSSYIKGAISPMTLEQKSLWNAKQAYIALGQVLATCATLRIDSTPMEGFDAAAYDQILGLKEKNLQAAVVCTIGYRHEEDKNQHLKKVRKSSEVLFETI